jgi:hypothetical protein
MKSKLVIIGLMISSLLALSVSGQEIGPFVKQVILQDDRSADHLLIDITTGEYKFESCKQNIAIGGVGKVNITGCKLTLQDISETKRVLAEVDLCDRAGKVDIAFGRPSISNQSDPTVLEFVISDSNTRDSAFDCEPKPIVSK